MKCRERDLCQNWGTSVYPGYRDITERKQGLDLKLLPARLPVVQLFHVLFNNNGL